MRNVNYSDEQKFFVEASRLIQVLGEGYTLEQNPNLELSNFEKLRGHLSSNKQKQISSAKAKVRTDLRKFMSMFGNFTYKMDKNMQDPNAVHVMVKFLEALEVILSKKGDPMLYMMGDKLTKSINKLMKLSPVAVTTQELEMQ